MNQKFWMILGSLLVSIKTNNLKFGFGLAPTPSSPVEVLSHHSRAIGLHLIAVYLVEMAALMRSDQADVMTIHPFLRTSRNSRVTLQGCRCICRFHVLGVFQDQHTILWGKVVYRRLGDLSDNHSLFPHQSRKRRAVYRQNHSARGGFCSPREGSYRDRMRCG